MRKFPEFQSSRIIDQPARYEIILLGRLGESLVETFQELGLQVETRSSASCNTILTGVLTDQSALYGLLAQISDLGLPLVEVRRI